MFLHFTCLPTIVNPSLLIYQSFILALPLSVLPSNGVIMVSPVLSVLQLSSRSYPTFSVFENKGTVLKVTPEEATLCWMGVDLWLDFKVSSKVGVVILVVVVVTLMVLVTVVVDVASAAFNITGIPLTINSKHLIIKSGLSN